MFKVKWLWHTRLYKVTRQGHDVGNIAFDSLVLASWETTPTLFFQLVNFQR